MNSTPDARDFSMLDPRTQHAKDAEFESRLLDWYPRSLGTDLDKLRNFTKYVPRQSLSLFLAKHALFNEIVNVHGHIVECGVYLGGGLMTWAQLSAIYEPVNHARRVVGFDTFSGFPALQDEDGDSQLEYAVAGGLATGAEDDVRTALELFDLTRPIGHIPRAELVVGDAATTIPAYLEDNPQLVVALLYLDFDLYAPTRTALEHFVPRMPRGSVIAFDELGHPDWPGETQAVMDTLGLRSLRLERFPFVPQLSFAVVD